MSSTIIDSMIRIKNGYHSKKDVVELKYSKITENIIALLVQEKYIKGYRIDSKDGKIRIITDLLYHDGKPAISLIQPISKPGRRIYDKVHEIKSVGGGLGIVVLTTPKGVMTDKRARQLKVGGEVLFRIW